MAERKKVFISYAREDETAARQLSTDLDSAGFAPWFDRDSLRGGAKWPDAIKSAIRECDYFIALLSSRSLNKKGFVQAEIKHALNLLDEFPHSSIFVIPVRLEDCEPSDPKLAEINRVDLFPVWSRGVDRLVRAMDESLDELAPVQNSLVAEPIRGTAQVPDVILRGPSGLYGDIDWSTALKLVNVSNRAVVVVGVHCEWHVPKGRLISNRTPTLSTSDDISTLMDGEGDLLHFPLLLPGTSEKTLLPGFTLKWFDEDGIQLGFRDKEEGLAALPAIFGSQSNGLYLETYKATFVFHVKDGRPQRVILSISFMGFIGTRLDMSSLDEYAEHMKGRGDPRWSAWNAASPDVNPDSGNQFSMIDVYEAASRLLDELNLGALSNEEKGDVLKSLSARFGDVIIYTLLDYLDDEKKEAFRRALKNKATVEENVAQLAATIPGLYQAMQKALEAEYERIRAAMKQS